MQPLGPREDGEPPVVRSALSDGRHLEVDFAEGLAGRVVVAVAVAVAVGVGGGGEGGAREAAERVLADDLGAAVGVAGEVDAVGPVDLVVGEHAVAEREPAGPPPAAVVDPLVEDPGDARSGVAMAGLLLWCLLGRHGRGLLVRGGWIWGLGVAGSSSSCSSAASTPRSNAVAGGRGHLLSSGSGEEGWGRSSPRLHALDLV